jgi:hypothetical protein
MLQIFNIFKLTELVLDLMPSYTSPPQKIMEPLSITVDLGVNDETIVCDSNDLI